MRPWPRPYRGPNDFRMFVVFLLMNPSYSFFIKKIKMLIYTISMITLHTGREASPVKEKCASNETASTFKLTQ